MNLVDLLKKNIVMVPVVASVLVGTFTGVRYIVNLTDTINQNELRLTNLAVSSVYANTPIATKKIRLATVFIGICTLASSPMFNGLLLI